MAGDSQIEHESSFRDRVSTVTESGKRNWIYALKPEGGWYTIRNYLAVFYLAIFFSMPLIKVNGMPFMMINIPDGKFILFSKIFWPNDFFIFAIAMIAMIVLIVLFTVIFGRLFCGWACPQTFFMEFVFRKIEWWIEGTPSQQRKLDAAPWNAEKLRKKGLKHLVFFGISFLIANTFLAYIISTDELFYKISQPVGENIGLLAGLVAFTFIFYGVFAYLRDIVCTTICPYGRLQGVMFDKDTMQISYDHVRGEPRGKFKKKVELNLGDCIDCKKCVVVCPTGIDIRNGVQMECVGCTACIDACDSIMTQLDLPKGLIRYASENQIITGKKFAWTARMKAYTVLLAGLLIFLSVLIGTRRQVDTYIGRVKGQTYQKLDNGMVSNLFDAKIINKTNRDIPVTLRLENSEGTIRLIGHPNGITLKKEAINKLAFFVERPKGEIKRRSSEIEISVLQGDKKIQTITTKFLGPVNSSL